MLVGFWVFVNLFWGLSCCSSCVISFWSCFISFCSCLFCWSMFGFGVGVIGCAFCVVVDHVDAGEVADGV